MLPRINVHPAHLDRPSTVLYVDADFDAGHTLIVITNKLQSARVLFGGGNHNQQPRNACI